MKVKDLQILLDASAPAGIFNPDEEITGAYVSDMLSAALARAGSGMAWVTIQKHMNILGVAAAKGIPAVIIAEAGIPDEETLRKAGEEKITLLVSPFSAFELAGKIYLVLQNDNQGGSTWNKKASRTSTRA